MRFAAILIILCGCLFCSFSQSDSLVTNQEAIYNRPFIEPGQTHTAVGGYFEGNTNYFSEDGLSEGFSMELRRFNIFLFSQLNSRIRFLSELEFEHGTEEIALETALLDLKVNQALNVRAGIILPALGLVNANHDSPKWEFIERPLSSTGLIPTTLSEVGFGIHGKLYPSTNSIFSYEAYVVNGLQDGIILNQEGRSDLASGKSEEMFGEDNNGIPMCNWRISYTQRDWGEIGISYYGGVYNSYKMEGQLVDVKRHVHVFALDLYTKVGKLDIKGEGVIISIDVPEDIREIYGTKQFGGFVDLIYPLLSNATIFNFEQASLNLALRLEYADFNAGSFSTNIQTPIGDENRGLAIGIGLRPIPGTVLRLNYRKNWIKDNLGNPDVRLTGFQMGFASYF